MTYRGEETATARRDHKISTAGHNDSNAYVIDSIYMFSSIFRSRGSAPGKLHLRLHERHRNQTCDIERARLEIVLSVSQQISNVIGAYGPFPA